MINTDLYYNFNEGCDTFYSLTKAKDFALFLLKKVKRITANTQVFLQFSSKSKFLSIKY